MLVFKWVN